MSRPKNSLEETNGVERAPVGVPIGKFGLDARDNPRGRHPLSMSELTNAVFADDRVFTRRPGHDGYQIHGKADTYSPTVSLTDEWVYGFGGVRSASPTVTSPYAIQTRGVFEQSGAACVWTGDRVYVQGAEGDNWFGRSTYWDNQNLYTGISTGRQDGIVAYLPTDTTTRCRVVDSTGVVESVVVEGETSYCVFYLLSTDYLIADVFDRETGARISTSTINAGTDSWADIKGTYSAGRFVVAFRDDVNHIVYIYTATEEDPDNWTEAEQLTTQSYDIGKSETGNRYLVVYRTGASEVSARWYNGADTTGAAVVLSTTGTVTGRVYVAVRRDDAFLVTFKSGSDCAMRLFNEAGTALAAQASIASVKGGIPVSRRQYDSGGYIFEVFAGFEDGYVKVYRYTGGATSLKMTRMECTLLSRPFVVGDEVFCWLRHSSDNDQSPQEIGFLIAGVTDAVTAESGPRVVGYAHAGECAEVSWPKAPSRVPGEAHQLSFGLITASRFSPTYSTGRNAIYRHLLDFLPQLSWAQLGKTTYFAGATLQMFDGINVTEAALPTAPAVASLTGGSGGSLATDGKYRYRVYATYTNAVGEVVRSPSYVWPEPSEGAHDMAGDNQVTIAIETYQPTSFGTDLKFEIYRTESTENLQQGTVFYLCNTAVVSNDPTATTISYVDTIADSELIKRRQDVWSPTSPAPVLEEVAPPGCTVVVAGKDRLWLAGGAIAPGSVHHSLLKQGGSVAAFNDLVGSVQIDLDGRAITSMAAWNDNMIVFQRDRVFVLQGDGPNNLGIGGFPPAALVASQSGATTHAGTRVCEEGVLFWTSGGPRLLDGRLNVKNIADGVESIARSMNPTGCAVIVGKREARWYTAEGVGLLWDWTPISDSPEYSTGRWSKWFGVTAAGVLQREGQAVELVTPTGKFWRESATNFSDGGASYVFSFATSDLRPLDMASGDNMLFQVGLLGEYKGPHTLRCWVYYNGEGRPSERFEWAPGTNIDATDWQDNAADWEDDDNPADLSSPDGVYRFLKRVGRQRFATVRVRFSDQGAVTNTFIPYEVVLEWGASAGPAKVPVRTFT